MTASASRPAQLVADDFEPGADRTDVSVGPDQNASADRYVVISTGREAHQRHPEIDCLAPELQYRPVRATEHVEQPAAIGQQTVRRPVAGS